MTKLPYYGPLASQARRHNTTVEHLAQLRDEQGNRCAICGRMEDQDDRLMAVDHDHKCCPGTTSCGECIRGLLCINCNHALGKFQDDPKILRSAIRYLEDFSAATGE